MVTPVSEKEWISVARFLTAARRGRSGRNSNKSCLFQGLSTTRGAIGGCLIGWSRYEQATSGFGKFKNWARDVTELQPWLRRSQTSNLETSTYRAFRHNRKSALLRSIYSPNDGYTHER
jgi:hypothetical protein